MTRNKQNFEENEDGSITLSTPAEIAIITEEGERGQCCPPGNDKICTFSAHQLVFVGGQVKTTVTPHCVTRVKCLNSGFGDPGPSGTPGPCTFRFYQNLCVEVDLTVAADARCVIDQIKCMGVSPGPCSTR